jgi:hypothetical protein
MGRERAVLVAIVLLAAADSASAGPEPWYHGPRGRHRALHLAVSVAGGAGYIVSETALKPALAPSRCRWCDPTGYDVTIRNALRWQDASRAVPLSDIDGFVVAPVVGIGLTMLASTGYEGDHLPRWLDDTIPVLEAGVLSGVLNQIVKFSVAEQRPYVHYGDPARPHQLDDDVSFYSGHSTLSFAIATSAGLVAHERHYSLEPVVWGAGYAIAVSTAYLRMAGDQHYFSDVFVGAVVGTGIGIAVPLGLHARVLSDRDIAVMPTANGLLVVGTF